MVRNADEQKWRGQRGLSASSSLVQGSWIYKAIPIFVKIRVDSHTKIFPIIEVPSSGNCRKWIAVASGTECGSAFFLPLVIS